MLVLAQDFPKITNLLISVCALQYIISIFPIMEANYMKIYKSIIGNCYAGLALIFLDPW